MFKLFMMGVGVTLDFLKYSRPPYPRKKVQDLHVTLKGH